MVAITLAAKVILADERWSVPVSTGWFVIKMEVNICCALIMLAVILQYCSARIHKLEVKVRMSFVNCVFQCVEYKCGFRWKCQWMLSYFVHLILGNCESLFIVRQFLRHCLYDYRMMNVNISHSVRLVSTRVDGLQWSFGIFVLFHSMNKTW
jgi:hypothetical protein